MRNPWVVTAGGALIVVMTGYAAAETPPLLPGSRVRVKLSAEQKRLKGTRLTLDNQTLRLRVEDEAVVRVFAREEVLDLDVSAGRRSLGRRALYGAAAGAVGGAIAADRSWPGGRSVRHRRLLGRPIPGS